MRAGMHLKLRLADIVFQRFINAAGHSGKIHFRDGIGRSPEEPQMVAAESQQIECASGGEPRDEWTDFKMLADEYGFLEREWHAIILNKSFRKKYRQTVFLCAPESSPAGKVTGRGKYFSG